MGNIFKMHSDPHRDTLLLLPWFVTEQLDAADRARVEAHLDGCGECRAALSIERRLDREIARMPSDVDTGWANIAQQLDFDHGAAAPVARHSTPKPRDARQGSKGFVLWPPSWRPWPSLVLASLAGLALVTVQVPAPFVALGTAPAKPPGNVIVIFQPDTSELVFRQTLRSSDARLVDGPTAANAYVLAVPASKRGDVLNRLRSQPAILLAEPVEAQSQ